MSARSIAIFLKAGVGEPVRARKCMSESAISSLGLSERPKIEPERACSSGETSENARSHAIFFKVGANEASRGDKYAAEAP